MDVQNILTAVRSVYGACTSYEDQGTLSTFSTLPNQTESYELVQEFSTTYIRPGILKFTIYNLTDNSEIKLESTGDVVRSLAKTSLGNFIDSHDSLKTMLTTTIGTTGFVLATAASFLSSDFPGGINEVETVERLEDESLNDVDCHVLAFTSAPWKHRVWIAKRSSEIKQVVSEFEPNEDLCARLNQSLEVFVNAGELNIQPEELSAQVWPKTVSTFVFNEITFNNSITIDAVI